MQMSFEWRTPPSAVVEKALTGQTALHRARRRGILRISVAQSDAAEPSAEVERHPGNPLADAIGDECLHLGLGAVFRAGHPDPGAIPDAAVLRIGRADLDEHILAQFGEPFVGT